MLAHHIDALRLVEYGQLAALPKRDRSVRLHWIMMFDRDRINTFDLDWSRCECLRRVTSGFRRTLWVGNERLIERRRHIGRRFLRVVCRRNKPSRVSRLLECLGHYECDRLKVEDDL